jgi:hypothetical protein
MLSSEMELPLSLLLDTNDDSGHDSGNSISEDSISSHNAYLFVSKQIKWWSCTRQADKSIAQYLQGRMHLLCDEA